MLNSIYEKVNRMYKKDTYYETYLILANEDAVAYDRISRKEIIEVCVKIYKDNPGIINYLFNEEELDTLYSMPESVKHNEYRMISVYSNFFLYCARDFSSDYTITLELKEVIDQAKNIYVQSKEKIEKEKEYSYIAVGLFRAYGALTSYEYHNLFYKLTKNQTYFPKDSYYFNRFVSFDDFNSRRCVFVLKGMEGYSEELIESHPNHIRLSYNIETLKEIGCYYFDRNSPHYVKAVKHERIKKYLNETDLNDLIILAGANLATEYYINQHKRFILDLSKEEENDFFTMLDCMPKYILNKNLKNVLSEEDGNLFYEIMMPFYKYAGEKYGLEFDFHNTQYNATQAQAIIEKCIEDRFKYVYDYLKDNNLPEEYIAVIRNLKHIIKGPFLILKHLSEGTVFVDGKNNLYLVKGIKSSIEKMEMLCEIPTICDTFLFQFKDSIVYSSILIPYSIQLVGNMKKEYMDLYRRNKDKIIKRIQ